MVYEKFYTLGDKLISFENVDFNQSQSDVEFKYGWEACMYWSTFYHQELNFRNECSVRHGDTFVDLGSNIGMSSRYAEKAGAKQIYAFEADPEIYKCLEKNKSNNWKIFNCALTDHRGSFEIGLWPTLKEKALVPAITLDDVFNMCNLEHIDYLKIDIEGSERSLFNTISDEKLRKIDRIFIEWHYIHNISDVSNQKIMEGFITRINQAGFNGWTYPEGYQAQLYFWRI